MAETEELRVVSDTQLKREVSDHMSNEALLREMAEEAEEDFAAAVGEDNEDFDEDYEFSMLPNGETVRSSKKGYIQAAGSPVRSEGEGDGYDEDEYDVEDDDFEAADTTAKPYQNKLQREVVKKKNTSISLSQAKLFGIPMDDKGNVKVPNAKAPDTDKQLNKILSRIGKMSDPVTSDLSHIKGEDDYECTFKVTKSAAAVAAMRNPKLGYDFIDKLESEKDGFLKRAFPDGKSGEMTSLEKVQKQDAEEEYKARRDKLECPDHMAKEKCRREQSFTEWWEKKRFCPQCKVRFVNLNTCDPARFERRMKENEDKRQRRLKKVEEQMYGYRKPSYRRPQAFQLDLPSGGHGRGRDEEDDAKDDGLRTVPSGRAVAKENKAPKQAMQKAGVVEIPRRSANDKKTGSDNEAMDQPGQSEEDLSAALLRQLATLNAGKADLMNEVVARAEGRVQAAREFEESTTLPQKVGGGRPSRSGASSKPSSMAASKVSVGSSSNRRSSKGSKKSGGGGGGAKAAPSIDSALQADAKGDKFDLLLA